MTILTAKELFAAYSRLENESRAEFDRLHSRRNHGKYGTPLVESMARAKLRFRALSDSGIENADEIAWREFPLKSETKRHTFQDALHNQNPRVNSAAAAMKRDGWDNPVVHDTQTDRQ